MKWTRKWTILLVIVVIAAAGFGGYAWYKRNAGLLPYLDGRWKLDQAAEGCFTTVRFMNNPLGNNGGVSLETTSDRVVKLHYGTYTKKSSGITVALTNPEMPPFGILPELQEDALRLTYHWEGADYTCIYAKNS